MPDSTIPRQVRSAGRPPRIDPDAVAAVAVRLFAARGYEATSMDEIAAAAGIGRKSLYRYFPSKSALVWGGLEEATAASRGILGDRDASAPGDPLEVLRAAAVASVRALPDLAVTRGRLRLIAEHPELGAHSYAMLEGQRQAVVDFLVDSGLSSSRAYYVSAAYSAALFAGWLHWAKGEDAEPLPHLLEALHVLRIPGP
ncbi:TetR family transcriptional regulator [Paeniglutamicibacter kerguelensis]|uniref:AcrR family transcriptional regulator n=1 Tax=Paeniglutamicibacter kerguelensis TaxID=254788 RepID=A0ABS4XB51_9MICC|nr:TetR family transcriptional regulator [Paeniglutamicibacter kerguelensis]MBP2385697.1 AcrR family transcriptional regulator [Paeniglutamicibacter kerguelensis]